MTSPAYIASIFGERIVNISQVAGSNVAVIDTFGAHNMLDGTRVLIQYVEGISNINGNTYSITSIGPSKFSIPIALQGAYTRNGTFSLSGYINHSLSRGH